MKRLTPAELCKGCDPDDLGFATTDDLEDVDNIFGQERAVEAFHFGLDMQHEGYNLFVLGPSGAGRHRLARRLLEARAAEDSRADDWCYVYAFPTPSRPRVLRLPPGRGGALRDDMARLVLDLKASLTAAFESDAYQTGVRALEAALAQRQREAVRSVEEHARQRGVTIVPSASGFGLAPTREGKALPLEALEQLPEDERGRIKANLDEVGELLQAALWKMPAWVNEREEATRRLDVETATHAVEPLFQALRAHWKDHPSVLTQLEQAAADVIHHTDDFLGVEGAADALEQVGLTNGRWQRRYEVNLLVDNADASGAPVVYEDDPTLQALVGRVEHHTRLGTLITDFSLIQAGALHRANGGYLLLDAVKVLEKPLAWEQLKRALRSREIRIQSLGQTLNTVSSVSLEPAPIPLDLKVVLVGDRALYYLLAARDPEFPLLFKVPVDIEDRVDRTPAGTTFYARLVATLARQDGLRAFDCGAVARVVVQASRLAGDGEKLTTHMDSLTDLLREADHYAGRAGRAVVAADDVREAVARHRNRHGRLADQSLEQIVRGTVRVQSSGEVVGQINGLVVSSLGQSTFGHPGRITARVRLGRGRVLDIEREVKLGGAIHSKGVLILSGYIGGRYASDRPLALSASLVFEQSYGGVDGDSASLAETCALLSALSELPLRQDVAVTGSIDQRGRVQAVGGVNQKIEGFFDVCSARGLTGAQGVVLPASNSPHLVLREDVVAAVTAERFHVWTAEHVDEVMALLTGATAGDRGDDGGFPAETINGRVEARLLAMAERASSASELGRD